MKIFLSAFTPENLVSPDGFGRLVPREPAHPTNSDCICCLSTRFLPTSALTSIYLDHHTPSGRYRVYRVTQLRTNGGHCRESTAKGPVVLEVEFSFQRPYVVANDCFANENFREFQL